MKNLDFILTKEVSDLGLNVFTARIRDVKNSSSTPELEEYLNSELEKISQFWRDKNYKEDPILYGFRDLHTKVGRSNRDYVASPEVLLRLFLEKGKFPRINSIVDIYNLISLKTRLALGAHDVGKIKGNVTLRLTKGDENFIPLGKTEPIKIPAGEYAYIDDGNNIICRLEVLQVEPTKVTLNSEDIFLIIQGNSNTDDQYIKITANEVIDLILRYCGGKYIS